ncbi:hypothetical protein H0H93_012208, partial [Arthromyces matolae]
LCNEEDDQYAMRLVRFQEGSKEHAQFREQQLEAQRSRAERAQEKQREVERKKKAELVRLASIGLVVERNQIEKMTVSQLDDQINIHRKFLNDTILQHVLQKELKNKAIKTSAVLAASCRNEEFYELTRDSKIETLRIFILRSTGLMGSDATSSDIPTIEESSRGGDQGDEMELEDCDEDNVPMDHCINF